MVYYFPHVLICFTIKQDSKKELSIFSDFQNITPLTFKNNLRVFISSKPEKYLIILRYKVKWYKKCIFGKIFSYGFQVIKLYLP